MEFVIVNLGLLVGILSPDTKLKLLLCPQLQQLEDNMHESANWIEIASSTVVCITAVPQRAECYYLKARHELSTFISWLCMCHLVCTGQWVRKGHGSISDLMLGARTDLPCCLSMCDKLEHEQLVLRLCSSLPHDKPRGRPAQTTGTRCHQLPAF